MNSEGSIFTDYDGPIEYKEYGAYAQLQKKFLDDRLKFTGSVRYDKSQNFDGNISPRISFPDAHADSSPRLPRTVSSYRLVISRQIAPSRSAPKTLTASTNESVKR